MATTVGETLTTKETTGTEEEATKTESHSMSRRPPKMAEVDVTAIEMAKKEVFLSTIRLEEELTVTETKMTTETKRISSRSPKRR